MNIISGDRYTDPQKYWKQRWECYLETISMLLWYSEGFWNVFIYITWNQIFLSEKILVLKKKSTFNLKGNIFYLDISKIL